MLFINVNVNYNIKYKICSSNTYYLTEVLEIKILKSCQRFKFYA